VFVVEIWTAIRFTYIWLDHTVYRCCWHLWFFFWSSIIRSYLFSFLFSSLMIFLLSSSSWMLDASCPWSLYWFYFLPIFPLFASLWESHCSRCFITFKVNWSFLTSRIYTFRLIRFEYFLLNSQSDLDYTEILVVVVIYWIQASWAPHDSWK
jgi:hypothetical protein